MRTPIPPPLPPSDGVSKEEKDEGGNSWCYDGHWASTNLKHKGRYIEEYKIPSTNDDKLLLTIGVCVDIDARIQYICLTFEGGETTMHEIFRGFKLPRGACLYPAIGSSIQYHSPFRYSGGADADVRLFARDFQFCPNGFSALPSFQNRRGFTLGLHRGETALMAASRNGHVRVVERLLARVEGRDKENVNMSTSHGITALMFAAE